VDDCHFDYITKPLKETLVETLSLSLSPCLELTTFPSLDLFYGSHHTKEHELREKEFISMLLGWESCVF
jgi:hypothetical protein